MDRYLAEGVRVGGVERYLAEKGRAGEVDCSLGRRNERGEVEGEGRDEGVAATWVK